MQRIHTKLFLLGEATDDFDEADNGNRDETLAHALKILNHNAKLLGVFSEALMRATEREGVIISMMYSMSKRQQALKQLAVPSIPQTPPARDVTYLVPCILTKYGAVAQHATSEKPWVSYSTPTAVVDISAGTQCPQTLRLIRQCYDMYQHGMDVAAFITRVKRKMDADRRASNTAEVSKRISSQTAFTLPLNREPGEFGPLNNPSMKYVDQYSATSYLSHEEYQHFKKSIVRYAGSIVGSPWEHQFKGAKGKMFVALCEYIAATGCTDNLCAIHGITAAAHPASGKPMLDDFVVTNKAGTIAWLPGGRVTVQNQTTGEWVSRFTTGLIEDGTLFQEAKLIKALKLI